MCIGVCFEKYHTHVDYIILTLYFGDGLITLEFLLTSG